jgi:hypothetical protein
MEPDEVGAKQTLGDLGAPRHLHEQLHRREWNMQKEADDQVGPQHPQHLRHQLKLIVLHPYRRALCRHLRGGLGEAAVDVNVGIPPLAVIDRLDDDVVVQRPQCRVREALVVVGYVVGRQPDRAQEHVVLLDRLVVSIGYSRPADPRTAATAQQRLQSGD